MRKKTLADRLFPKTRQKLLSVLLLHPERSFFLSDLARHLQVGPSSLQRELGSLVSAGILKREAEGKHVYFQADPDCPVLPELQSLMIKTVGLVEALRQALQPTASDIRIAFVYGSLARGEALSESDVDLLVVGSIGLSRLSPLLRKVSHSLGREVNATVYSTDEFRRKASEHFLRSVLDREKLFVLGSRHELEEALGGETSRASSAQRGGARRTP